MQMKDDIRNFYPHLDSIFSHITTGKIIQIDSNKYRYVPTPLKAGQISPINVKSCFIGGAFKKYYEKLRDSIQELKRSKPCTKQTETRPKRKSKKTNGTKKVSQN